MEQRARGPRGAADPASFRRAMGVLGSVPVFSTCCLDTVALWGDGRSLFAVLNVGGSVVCGLLLVAVERELSAWLLGG